MTTTLAPAPISSGAFDQATIDQLWSLAEESAPELLTEILGMFQNDMVKYLSAMQGALAANDAATLERSAHALKGAGLNTGALTMGGICAQIETAAETGGLTMVPSLLAQLEAEVRRVMSDIGLMLGGRS